MISAFGIFITLCFILANVYALVQILHWVRRCFMPGTARRVCFSIAGILFVLATLLPLIGAFASESALGFLFQRWGNVWLTFLIYLGMGLLVLHIIRLIVWLKERPATKGLTRKERRERKKSRIANLTTGQRWFARVGFLACIVFSVSVSTYGLVHAQQVVVNEYDVTINEQVRPVTRTWSDVDGDPSTLRIALIADTHLGVNSHQQLIADMVQAVNDADVDVVLVAGDIFNSTYDGLRNADEYAQILSCLRSTYGTYAVWGNHDVVEPLLAGFALEPREDAYRSAEMEQFVEAANFTMVEDEVVPLANGTVQLVGRLDESKTGDGATPRMTAYELMADVDQRQPIIVLEHEPADYGDLALLGTDLCLSGHTHDGQIFPANIVTRIISVNSHGYKNVAGLDSMVTAGVGYYGPPARIGTDSEVAIINVTFAG